ncbi:MAG: phytanoyl-CoA dioxygenase family protein [Gammaproteobacteria bacterium]
MNSSPMRPITDAQAQTYRDDGVVLLPGLFDPEWVEYLRPLIDQTMADPGPLHLELEEAGRGRFFFDTFLWPRNARYKRFIDRSPAAAIAGRLMGSAKVNTFFDQLLIKEPGTAERTPWHHDLPYWPIAGDQVCTLWLALDSVSAESGAVEYVRGSHLSAKQYHPAAFAGDDRYQTGLERIPDFEALRGELDIVQFDMTPGDCTVHHALTVHSAPGNASTKLRRRAYVTRWAGDNVVYEPEGNVMPILRDPGLNSGDPLDSELWPVVWRA